jgi:transcriptional regulator with XRE-family HTH domain
MKREQVLARLLRALSGMTQEQIGEEIGVHTSLIAQFELGRAVPSREHLERMAKAARLTLRDAEEILRLGEALQQPRLRRGEGAEDLLDELAQEARSKAGTGYEHLLRLPIPDSSPQSEDHQRAEELFARLEGMHPETRLVMVRLAEGYQSWALCERVCRAAEEEASRDAESAAAWVGLAQEIAARVRGPEEWRNHVQGYAAAHAAHVLQVSGLHSM